MIATKPLDLRSNLKKYMDFAFHGNPVVIARPKNENVVMLSEQEYNELAKAKQNAEYLQRIDHSYEQLAKNQTISFSLENSTMLLHPPVYRKRAAHNPQVLLILMRQPLTLRIALS